MELVSFRDRIFGKLNSKLYVLDSIWGCMRPIGGLAWGGKRLEIVERFKADLFSPFYGYESSEDKIFCENLEIDTSKARKLETPPDFWRWSGQQTEWLKDRPIVFLNDCVSRDSWKLYLKYLETRAKTLRHIKGKLTKRIVLK